MAKGGFLSALLAERNSTSTKGFALRSLYYVWVGIPLLFLYYVIFWYVLGSFLAQPIEAVILNVTGFDQAFRDQKNRQEEILRKAFESGRMGDIEGALEAISMYILGALSGVLLFDSLVKLAVVAGFYHFGLLDILLQPVYMITSV